MSPEGAQFFWICIGAYLAVGGVIGLFTAVKGAALLDHAGAGASMAFRFIALPGFIVMWPALLVRYGSFRRINADPHNGPSDTAQDAMAASEHDSATETSTSEKGIVS